MIDQAVIQQFHDQGWAVVPDSLLALDFGNLAHGAYLTS